MESVRPAIYDSLPPATHPAVARYERGESRPPVPLVKLLKLIDRHPNLLGEVRNS